MLKKQTYIAIIVFCLKRYVVTQGDFWLGHHIF